ncbi:MAG: serine protease [Tannerellaceae bacterium]|jgi:tetratricopeptide (TPR) repeat protein|nr:serine protease [Tannerellaceae bacterium]
MRRISLFIICCLSLPAVAQKAPKWIEKSKKAVITINTFDRNDRKLHTTNGFFISDGGEALSGYSAFKGADKATVTDPDGSTYPVVAIIGADDLYDVIRFKVAVNKKVTFLPLASEPLSINTPAYLLPFAPGKDTPFKEGTISEVSKLKDPYGYYQLTIPFEDGQDNTPLLLASGQVFGLMQQDASGKKEQSYAVSTGYVKSLNVTSTDAFNSVYTNIGIRKAWPADIEQASVSLFLLAASQDAKTYLETLTDFIATFPNAEDGYLTRASHYATNRKTLAATPSEEANYLNLALSDIQTAARYSKSKGDVHYNQAKLIYNIAINDTTITDNNWTVQAAMAALTKAIEAEDLPVYRQLEGDIYFYLGEFPSAYASYMKVNESNLASSDSYYFTAKALENIPGTQISNIITLLDSAISKMGSPTPPRAAPYILERIDRKIQLSFYDEALADFDLYYTLVNGQVNENFYFFREQAKFQKGDIEGALEDIKQAILQNDQSPDYYAEEAAIYVRLQQYNEALESIRKALELAPDFGACYRLKGICYTRLNNKTEACEAFYQAEKLNDPLAKRLIREHCN